MESDGWSFAFVVVIIVIAAIVVMLINRNDRKDW